MYISFNTIITPVFADHRKHDKHPYPLFPPRIALSLCLLAAIALFGCAEEPVKPAKPTEAEKPSFSSLPDMCKRGASLIDWIACNDYAAELQKYALEEAEIYYKKACDHQIGAGCSNPGYIAANRPQKPDYPAALRYYEQGCNLRDGNGCHNLANLYLEGNALPRDDKKAVSLLVKSCEFNFGQACYWVGLIALIGKLLPKDEAAAAKLYQKACDLSEVVGCYDLAYLYLDGKGVAKDPKKAFELIDLSCAMNFSNGCETRAYFYQKGIGESCRYLADFHAKGRGGVPRSKQMASHFRKLACDYGEKVACR